MDYDGTNERLYLNDNISETITAKENKLYHISEPKIEYNNTFSLDYDSKIIPLTGTVNIVEDTNKYVKILGTNTLFSSEVSIGESIIININGNSEIRIVSEITSDTVIIVDEEFSYFGLF